MIGDKGREIAREIVRILEDAGVDFSVAYPCNWLRFVIEELERSKIELIIPTREEEGVAIAAGAYLGGRKPVALMQSSGIGNCANVLASLHLTYRIPLPIIISHRGTLGERISAQLNMGRASPEILRALNIRTFFIRDPDDLWIMEEAIRISYLSEEPIGIFMSKRALLGG